MKKNATFIYMMLFIFLIAISHAQNESKDFPVLKGPYLGQKPPGELPQLFMLGVISNCDLHSGVYFSPDGKEVFYSISKESQHNIMFMKEENGRWTRPQSLCTGLAPFLSPDGKTLYVAPDESYMIFSSFRSGGYGMSDLYISFRGDDGIWSEPRNMGPNINSDAKDRFPYVSSDGEYFFFNSSRVSVLNTKPIPGGPGNVYWVDAKIIEELRLKEQN